MILPNFTKNCMKLRKFWAVGGGTRQGRPINPPLGKVMFSQVSVILSTGGKVYTHWKTLPLGRHPQADTPLRQTPPRQTSPSRQTPLPIRQTPRRQTPPPHETATAVDGTHPTGMHSCKLVLNPIH